MVKALIVNVQEESKLPVEPFGALRVDFFF